MKTGKIVIAAAVVIAVLSASAVLSVLYVGSRPWLFGGSGAPDMIYLNDSHRLEKVMAFRKNYRVNDVKNGTVIYTGGNNDIYGAVSFSGEPVAHAESHGLAFDENGNVVENSEQRSAEQNADSPSYVIDISSGSDMPCYENGGLKAVLIDGVLGVIDEKTGETVTLFRGDGSRESLWQLEDPLFFGEYVCVRIYWCDCIYRIIRESE